MYLVSSFVVYVLLLVCYVNGVLWMYIILFSLFLCRGMNIRKEVKYHAVIISLRVVYGGSAGFLPIHVNSINVILSNQVVNFKFGR